MIRCKLIVLSGPDSGTEYVIEETTSVGRSSSCDITISDPSLSRNHFEINNSEETLKIKDLRSFNGTFVDGRLTTECPFKPGLIISAGSSEFTLIEHSKEAEFSNQHSIQTTIITSADAIGQLFADTNEHKDLIILYRTARRLPLCTTIAALGQALLKPICNSFKNSCGSIFLIHRDGKLQEGSWYCETNTPYKASVTLLKKTISTEESHLDLYEDGSSSIAVPLKASGKLIAILFIHKDPLMNKAEPTESPKGTALPNLAKSQLNNHDLCIATALGEIGGPALSNLVTRIRLSQDKGRFHQIIRESTGMIGNSSSIREITKLISKLGTTTTPVLILGETGTGKELVAKAIHYNGNRASGPMISVNCAALVDEMAESELFGHVKGAFTGALKDRKGRFSLANKGTLFLDEVGELSLLIQGKLLRVIETSTFTPVGSTNEQKVDLRIVCATNRDLMKRVEEGLFRQDLYFRLSGFPLPIPPLRERKEDITELAMHFTRKFSSKMGFKKIPKVPQAMMENFRNYEWPGNIRELSNVIERILVLSENEILSLLDLPNNMMKTLLNCEDQENKSNKSKTIENLPCENESAENKVEEISIDQDLTLELNEANHILNVLRLTDWNKKQSASLLGIERATLYKKIEKYGLTSEQDS